MAQQVRTKSKPKDANIAIYSFSDKPDTFIGYKLSNDGSFSEIVHVPDSTELAPNFTATSFATPDEDCLICAIYRGEAICFNVGLPDKKFVYYAVNEGLDLAYQQLSLGGEEIETGHLLEAGAGFYYIDITIADPSSIVIVEDTPFIVKTALSEVTVQPTSGVIKIQNDVWQLIAIPRAQDKVKEYFCDRLAAKYNADATDMIEICSAFFGSENKFRSYIPGVTKATTANNFPLIYNDGVAEEVTGFWVKIKDLSNIVSDIDNVTLSWDS
jgi:hypothetical protein